MTNIEYWKDRILEIVKSGDVLALKNGNPTGCYHTICENCNFYNGKTHGCNVNRIAWLYSEHEEKPKLTKRERKLCEALGTGWIAANKDGAVYWHGNFPVKSITVYNGSPSMYLSGAGFQFDFIDFEDEEPWMVENLLLLDVEE